MCQWIFVHLCVVFGSFVRFIWTDAKNRWWAMFCVCMRNINDNLDITFTLHIVVCPNKYSFGLSTFSFYALQSAFTYKLGSYMLLVSSTKPKPSILFICFSMCKDLLCIVVIVDHRLLTRYVHSFWYEKAIFVAHNFCLVSRSFTRLSYCCVRWMFWSNCFFFSSVKLVTNHRRYGQYLCMHNKNKCKTLFTNSH